MTNPTSELLDRTPPSDLDAERMVLGSLLLAPGELAGVAALLRPDAFYAEAHRKVYAAMLAAHDATGGLDVKVVVDYLKQAGNLDAVGGMAYIAELAQSVPVAAHARYYARVVAKKAKYRAVIEAGKRLVQAGFDESAEPHELLNTAEATLAAVETDNYQGAPVTAKTAAMEALDRIEQIQQTGRSAGLMTGLPSFDERMGGLFPGELVILAARTSVGKTSLACQIAEHNASRGRGVYLASLEMSACEIATRLICGASQVDSRRVRRAELDEQDLRALVLASQPWVRWPLWIHDRPGISVPEIARWARRYRRDGLALVVVDYLQLLTPTDARVKRHEQIGQMTAGLKAVARELAVPVLCLAQLNREAAADEKSPPRLSQLRESGSIEQDTDVVLFLWRNPADNLEKDRADPNDQDALTRPDVVQLRVAKNRNGPIGLLQVKWHPERTRFDCGEDGGLQQREVAF